MRQSSLCVFATIFLLLRAMGASPPPADLLSTPIPDQDPTPYAAWTNGLSSQSNFFPIAVWLQDPSLALTYKAAGFNLYLGLYLGPTEAQISALRAADMPVICTQNDYARLHLDDPIIVGWMHGDEPDNAKTFAGYWQSDTNLIAQAWPEYAGRTAAQWGYYGPPASPSQITNLYSEIKSYDDSRPVLMNMGQGVGWDGWVGRGVRTGHTEDYPQYALGCDIFSFDIYPVVHSNPDVAGELWRVPYGVKRLRAWGEERPAWAVIECTHISNPTAKATPAQVRAEAWMALIFGARGLTYFVHQFEPSFDASALLHDPEMLAAVTAINNQIQSLAAVLNQPSDTNSVAVSSSNPSTPVRTMVKHLGGMMYIFSVAMYDEATTATFNATGIDALATLDVLGEARTVTATNGVFSDTFTSNAVHIYKVALAPEQTLPFRETFEPDASMAGVIGALNAQHGWNAGVGAVVQTNEVYEFHQAAALSDSVTTHTFAGAHSNVWIALAWKPEAGAAPTLDDLSPGSSATFWIDTNRVLSAYSNSQVVCSGVSVDTSRWSRVLVNSDYVLKQWSLWLDGSNVFENVGFFNPSLSAFTGITFRAGGGTSYLDDIHIGTNAWHPAPGDTDGDGMQDEWERYYWASPNVVSNSLGDYDGDRVSNEGEEVSGTDPAEASSVFMITDVTADAVDSNYVIHWPSVSNRVYRVWWTTNLISNFTLMASNLLATPPENSYTDTVHTTHQNFYRIDVSPATDR